MVLLDECSCERETEAGASFAAGHEREEDLLAQCLRNARPVVLDMQFQCQTIAVFAERHLADDARAQGDLAVPASICSASDSAALRVMLRTAWISCSRSPLNSGIEVS